MASTVLITGSSHGIGRETAKLFARKGFNVVVNCRQSAAELEKLAAELEKSGAETKKPVAESEKFAGASGKSAGESAEKIRVLPIVRDVSRPGQVAEMFEIMSDHHMLPDLIINNAGISQIGLLQDMTPSEWNDVISVNLTSVFNVCKCAIPHLLHAGGGRILNISSVWGSVGASCEVAYSASKGGVNAFTKALAKELAPSGIQVNAVAFGAVDTRMNAFLSPEELETLIGEIPAGRLCTAAEAASVIYGVASANGYMTGQIITADGGWT